MISRRRARVLRVALALSIVFHLSAVTLFRIVIYFPRENVEYMDFQIVRADTIGSDLGAQLSVPNPDRALELMDAFASDLAPEPLSLGPSIELPRIEFDALDRLRMRMQSLEVGKRYDGRFGWGEGDLWSRFGRGLNQLSGALTSAVTGESDPDDPEPIALSTPAPGFEAYVEWLTPPYDRELISTNNIPALWGTDPSDLRGTIALPFRVDDSGDVVEVLRPFEGDADIVSDAMQALRESTFEPNFGGSGDLHMGTFIIRASSSPR